jgi:hypothetical protein
VPFAIRDIACPSTCTCVVLLPWRCPAAPPASPRACFHHVPPAVVSRRIPCRVPATPSRPAPRSPLSAFAVTWTIRLSAFRLADAPAEGVACGAGHRHHGGLPCRLSGGGRARRRRSFLSRILASVQAVDFIADARSLARRTVCICDGRGAAIDSLLPLAIRVNRLGPAIAHFCDFFRRKVLAPSFPPALVPCGGLWRTAPPLFACASADVLCRVRRTPPPLGPVAPACGVAFCAYVPAEYPHILKTIYPR